MTLGDRGFLKDAGFLIGSVAVTLVVAAILVQLSGFRISGSSLGAFGVVGGILAPGPVLGFLSGLK